MTKKAFQDYYDHATSHCYGCGRLNKMGLRIKSFWDDDSHKQTICQFTPQIYHTGIPGYVYGGLIASIIDCHSIGSAAAGVCLLEQKDITEMGDLRFVTASLHVDYKKPTPIDQTLLICSTLHDIQPHKVSITSTLSINKVVYVSAQVIAARMPKHFLDTQSS